MQANMNYQNNSDCMSSSLRELVTARKLLVNIAGVRDGRLICERQIPSAPAAPLNTRSRDEVALKRSALENGGEQCAYGSADTY